MNQLTSNVRRGMLVGMVGGMVMAMWSMIALAAHGDGFWAPLDLIAHTIWSGAPLDGSFHVGAAVLGMMGHLMTSMLLGVTIALLAGRSPGRAVGVAMAASMGAWVVATVAWPAIDDAAAGRFPGWALLIGHVMYGAAAAMAIGAVPTRRSAPQILAG
ncbi:MAG: hypothetical protein AB7W59_16870 [Acidimicrobiia bacterium]